MQATTLTQRECRTYLTKGWLVMQSRAPVTMSARTYLEVKRAVYSACWTMWWCALNKKQQQKVIVVVAYLSFSVPKIEARYSAISKAQVKRSAARHSSFHTYPCSRTINFNDRPPERTLYVEQVRFIWDQNISNPSSCVFSNMEASLFLRGAGHARLHQTFNCMTFCLHWTDNMK